MRRDGFLCISQKYVFCTIHLSKTTSLWHITPFTGYSPVRVCAIVPCFRRPASAILLYAIVPVSRLWCHALPFCFHQSPACSGVCCCCASASLQPALMCATIMLLPVSSLSVVHHHSFLRPTSIDQGLRQSRPESIYSNAGSGDQRSSLFCPTTFKCSGFLKRSLVCTNVDNLCASILCLPPVCLGVRQPAQST